MCLGKLTILLKIFFWAFLLVLVISIFCPFPTFAHICTSCLFVLRWLLSQRSQKARQACQLRLWLWLVLAISQHDILMLILFLADEPTSITLVPEGKIQIVTDNTLPITYPLGLGTEIVRNVLRHLCKISIIIYIHFHNTSEIFWLRENYIKIIYLK